MLKIDPIVMSIRHKAFLSRFVSDGLWVSLGQNMVENNLN